MKNSSDRAVEKFLEGYNCAQAVFSPFSQDLGVEENSALKIACGFGAGMGRSQEVCGAVTGGILAIGLKHGEGIDTDDGAAERTYSKTREFMERFSANHGSYICRKLLGGCDLKTPEGRKQFRDGDFRNRICVPCVRGAAALLEDII